MTPGLFEKGRRKESGLNGQRKNRRTDKESGLKAENCAMYNHIIAKMLAEAAALKVQSYICSP